MTSGKDHEVLRSEGVHRGRLLVLTLCGGRIGNMDCVVREGIPAAPALKVAATARACGVDVHINVATDAKAAAELFGDAALPPGDGECCLLESLGGKVLARTANGAAKAVALQQTGSATPLYPVDVHAQVDTDQWIAHVSREVEVVQVPWVDGLRGIVPFDGRKVGSARKAILASLQALEDRLALGPRLVQGTSANTLADVVCAAALVPLFTLALDPEVRADLPKLTAWFSEVTSQAPFDSLLSQPVVLCAEAVKPPPKEPKAPKEGKEGKGDGKGDGKGGKGKGGSGKGKEKDVGKGEKETGLGLSVKKDEDFSEWYSQVVVRAELIDYYDISGCYILRPWAYSIWECIRDYIDADIKAKGVENAYFPLFVSEAALIKEEDHIEGFAPEVAWVTRSGKSELEKPIAVRPTSETIMYPLYSKWIKSHRDLPLKLNQWCNVVRWEFKNPTPFIRSREFLWQEGHTAFADKPSADAEVLEILDLYKRVYEHLLCVPVVPGKKSEKEKFAGGLYTTTVEAYIPHTGRGIQGATSHCLGQSFAKMFNITYEDKGENGESVQSLVWQNSWGLTTRVIGVMIMVHGDDKGLVLPPRVAPTQVVIVPIPFKDEQREKLLEKAYELEADIKVVGVRVKTDDRLNYTPGWKYNHWEQKGVPLRVELGPRDLQNGVVVICRRDTGEKETIAWGDLPSRVQSLHEQIHADMLAKAKQQVAGRTSTVTDWKDFTPALDAGNMVLTPWCETKESEEEVEHRCKVESPGQAAPKTLCIPFEQPPLPAGAKCVVTGAPATTWVLWGRSY